jgi:hypothetical protein
MPRKSARNTSFVGAAVEPGAPGYTLALSWQPSETGWVGSLRGQPLATIRHRRRAMNWLLSYGPEKWLAPTLRAAQVQAEAVHWRLANQLRAQTTTGWRALLHRIIG